MTPSTAALSEIRCLSPRNVRGETGSADVRSIAASILAFGLIHPLVVEQWTDGFAVVDGGRRFAALRGLVDDGAIDMDFAVPIVVIDEAGAGEVSLAANVLRRDLHPVEEFEAFARLVAGGLSPEAVAAHFGQSLRFVRQRLTLDRLSPRVRAMWRADAIGAEAAIAFTRAPDHAAQDLYLDAVEAKRAYLYPGNITGHFGRPGTRRADSVEALYVGLEVYQAAGGAIDDNLFQDWSICEDGALLDRLAHDKMMADGAAILERTGFGTCLIEADVERSQDWGRLPVDVTPADRDELAAINAREAAAMDAAEGAGQDDDEAAVTLAEGFSAEREAVNLRALQRGTTADQRAQAAIFLRLRGTGRLHVDYGRTPPRTGKGGTSGPAASARAPEPAEPATPAPAPEKPPTKLVTECLDDARQRAFATLLAERPMLALLVCTAALRTGANRSPLRVAAAGRNGVIAEPPFTSFAGALTELLSLPDPDSLMNAFARAVAQTVAMVTPTYERNGGRADPTDTDGLALVLGHYAGDAYPAVMRAVFNYPAYFTAATRAAALAAIEAAGGDVNAARKLKAADVGTAAAELARDKGWLPAALRPPAKIARRTVNVAAIADMEREGQSLADAMDAAIEADQDRATVPLSESYVAEFVGGTCEASDAGSIDRVGLYSAFRWHAKRAARKAVPSLQGFDAAMHALGFRSDGPDYVGLQSHDHFGLRSPAAEA